MITPDWLTSELGYLQTHKNLQESIIRDVVRRLIKTDFNMSDTAAWQTEKLQQAGMVYSDIVSEVSKRTKKSTEDIRKVFADAKVEVFDYGDEVLEKAGYVPEEFKTLSPKMSKILNAAFKKTTKEVRNLTMTTASTTQNLFIRSCDLAHMQITSGAFTYQEAIKNAIKSAAKESIKIIYPSGKVTSLDAAVRRAVLTGTNQTAGKLQEMRADDMNVDLMEITAHSGARPEHAAWQGKVVSRSGRAGYLTLTEIGYGEVKGFMGANCRHNWHLYFEGISKSAYTKEQLEAFANETVTYNGEELAVWQARDQQRAMERSIRSSKQLLVAYDEAGKNVFTDEERAQWQAAFNDEAVKLKGKEAKLKDFCEQTGLNRDKFREQVFSTTTENGIKGFGKSVSQKSVHAAKQRYKEFVSVVGADNAPETLDKYYELKYNNKEYYKFLSLDYNRKTALLNNKELLLPNVESATAHEDKFVKYLFNPNNPSGFAKGENFRKRLGYSINNWQELREEILKKASQYPARFKGKITFGDKYDQQMIIYGKNGTPANVIASWCLDNNGIHLTSAYIKEVQK